MITTTCASFNHVQIFCQRINIVFTKYDIHTLVNVVNVDSTRINLLPWSCAIQGFVAFDMTQTKESNYRDQHPIDQFLPLVIEVFGCLHK
jgi:hypothetical protein